MYMARKTQYCFNVTSPQILTNCVCQQCNLSFIWKSKAARMNIHRNIEKEQLKD
jgi:hypothetical protein